MNPDLERLVRLQQLESFAEDARRRIAEEPQRLQALDSRLEESRSALAAARQRLTDSQSSRRALEKDLAVSQTRLSKFKDQLMEVKTNREYQAMQKEIEIAQSDARALEDRILERMLEADELAATVKRAEADLAQQEQQVAAERAALRQEIETLEQELQRSSGTRERLLPEIDPQILATFQQVARRRGVAVAEARNGHCTFCHVRLRPQVFNDIRRNDSIIQCESCQRILFFAAPVAADVPGGAPPDVAASPE